MRAPCKRGFFYEKEKFMLKIFLLILISLNVHSSEWPCSLNLLNKLEKGCEGEACFCEITNTKNPKVLKPVSIYKEPDLSSKKLKTLQKGDAIINAIPYFKRIKQGKAILIQSILLNKKVKMLLQQSDHVILTNYVSEGTYEFCFNDKLYSANEEIKVIKKPKVKEWLKVKLNSGSTGWTDQVSAFLFNEGC